MKVRFYGKLADIFGRELDISTDTSCSVAELRKLLAADYPHAAQSLQNKRVRAFIGNAIVHDEYLIPQGEVLELLAPVSGG